MSAHHPHSHDHGTGEVSDGVLLWTVILNAGLSVFEFVAGAVAGSVALMADALHNTNDAAALGIAWVARKISRKGADESFTFGYRRAELVGAMIQLTALILVGLYLLYEAAHRLVEPEPLRGTWIMAAAGVALVVDVATVGLLWAMSKGSVNVRAAFLHNLTDAGASVAVLIGGAAVTWLGWTWVDPALTFGIAGAILWMSYGMLRRTAAMLMEAAPPGLDLDEVRDAVVELEGVTSLHHLHVWDLDEDRRAMEAHLVVTKATGLEDLAEIRARAKGMLRDRFHIAHSTLELELPGYECEGPHC